MQEPELVEEVEIEGVRQAYVLARRDVVRAILEAFVDLRDHDEGELTLSGEEAQ